MRLTSRLDTVEEIVCKLKDQSKIFKHRKKEWKEWKDVRDMRYTVET